MIAGKAPVIVTFNLRDFQERALEPWKVAAVHPPDYLLTLYSMNPGTVLAKLAELATDHGTDFQGVLIHLGKSVPAFSRLLLQDSGQCLPE